MGNWKFSESINCFLNNLFFWNHVMTFSLQNIDHMTEVYHPWLQLKCRKFQLVKHKLIKKILKLTRRKYNDGTKTGKYGKCVFFFYFPSIIQIVKQVSPCYTIISITSYSESGPLNKLALQQQKSILCFKWCWSLR